MILVTGGTGIVGSHLLLRLSTEKKTIVATYRNPSKLDIIAAFFKHHGAEKAFKTILWKQADITDVDALAEVFEGITYVYHCAAFVSFAVRHREKLIKTNIEGTANIVNFCIKNKVKKIAYVSSIAALGAKNTKEKVTEDFQWNNDVQQTYYGYSKHGGELEIWRGTQEGIPAVIVNPGVILTSYFWKQSSGVLFRLVDKGLKFYPIGQTGFVAIEDVVFSLQTLMESKIENERYILVAENSSFREIITKIAKTLQKKPPTLALYKGILKTFMFLESIAVFFRLRKRSLSAASIDSICDTSSFDGSKITRHLPFNYQDISKSIEKIGAIYRA